MICAVLYARFKGIALTPCFKLISFYLSAETSLHFTLLLRLLRIICHVTRLTFWASLGLFHLAGILLFTPRR